MTEKEVKRVTLEPLKFDNPHQECGQETERLKAMIAEAGEIIRDVPTVGLMAARIYCASVNGPTVEPIGEAKRYQEWLERREAFQNKIRGGG